MNCRIGNLSPHLRHKKHGTAFRPLSVGGV